VTRDEALVVLAAAYAVIQTMSDEELAELQKRRVTNLDMLLGDDFKTKLDQAAERLKKKEI